ncbi:hypothetical protein BGZ58_002301 [Dissophora ornata]|nr:hypothetical protein BGZ58_002301 [Dissophora ornata]
MPLAALTFFMIDTLPSESSRDHDGEQTYINRTLQPFLSVAFSARANKIIKEDIEHESAAENKTTHKNGVRSDFFVIVPDPGSSVPRVGLVGEVKPPERSNS